MSESNQAVTPGFRRVNVIALCAELELVAKIAPRGRWTDGKRIDDDTYQVGIGGIDGKIVARGCPSEVAAYIVESQPDVVLAITAKLRDAYSLLGDAGQALTMLRDLSVRKMIEMPAGAVSDLESMLRGISERFHRFPGMEVPL